MRATPLVLVAIMVLAAPARSQEVEKTTSQDGSTLPTTEGIPAESESLPLPTIKFTPPPPPKEVPPMVVKAATVLQLPTVLEWEDASVDGFGVQFIDSTSLASGFVFWTRILDTKGTQEVIAP